MKLNNTDDRTLEGNLQGRTYQVGISDMRLIIDRLTDMYSNRQLACVREYSCNALDAHIAAGVTAPIEVSTPGALQPFLTIRDYGIGLTEEDIAEIYSQYGASTKRMSNDQTGAFGLGCKSALAYSDQFTVTSIKDGIRIQVVVSRDPKQGVTMKVVNEPDERTTEPNGTTVMIPARAGNTFKQQAEDFFKYWKKGTVILDGREPDFMPEAKWVTDDICINANSGYNQQSTVVMGGVPYPASIAHGLGYSSSITAFVPIGSVTPMPARESLGDDDDTLETLGKVTRDFKAGLQTAILKDIADADSAPEAARRRRDWTSKAHGNMPALASMKWRGSEVPDSYKVEEEGTILAPYYGRKMNAHSAYRKDQYIPLPSLEGALWLTNFDYASFTATVKKKMVKHCEDNNIDMPSNFVLTKSKPTSKWLSNVTFVDWQTVKAIKLPRNVVSTSSGRIPGSYDLFESGDWNEGVPGDDIDTQNRIFWMEGTRRYAGRHMAEYLTKSYPGCTLVMLRVGREEKFQRNFPSAVEAKAAVKADFDKWVKGLDQNTVRALALQQTADSRLETLDASKVDDPEIKKAKAVLNIDTTKLSEERAAWQTLGMYWNADDVKGMDNPLVKYALLPDLYDWRGTFRNHPDAIYRYLNCEYKFLTASAGN